MKKGIIFDVDGTLWDACQVVADAWNEYLWRNLSRILQSV